LFGILNGIGILLIMKRPINLRNTLLYPIIAVALISYFKFDKIVDKSMEFDSDKDPINSCMKLCKIAYTPFD
jgi:hypothetical protein